MVEHQSFGAATGNYRSDDRNYHYRYRVGRHGGAKDVVDKLRVWREGPLGAPYTSSQPHQKGTPSQPASASSKGTPSKSSSGNTA